MTALAVVAAIVAMTPQQKARTLVVTTVQPRIFSGAARITFADQAEASRPGSPFREWLPWAIPFVGRMPHQGNMGTFDHL